MGLSGPESPEVPLLRCYGNFVRPRRALQFGREVRTPVKQAGLTKRTANLQGYFLGPADFLDPRKAPVRVRLLCPLGSCQRYANAAGGLTTLDDGSAGNAVFSIHSIMIQLFTGITDNLRGGFR